MISLYEKMENYDKEEEFWFKQLELRKDDISYTRSFITWMKEPKRKRKKKKINELYDKILEFHPNHVELLLEYAQYVESRNKNLKFVDVTRFFLIQKQ